MGYWYIQDYVSTSMEKESTKVLGKNKTDIWDAESDGSMQEKRDPILVILQKKI